MREYVALPKIQTPIHTFKLPVLGKKIKYRPFTVKEEKILLMAAESNDPEDVYNAFQQVVNNCVVDDIDATKLHLFDLEILFMLLRVASVGEDATIYITDKETEEPIKIDLNLMTVINESIAAATIPTKQIQITEEIGIVMKDITMDLFVDASSMTEEMSAKEAFNLIKKLIESVFDKEDLYNVSEYSDEELDEFLDGFQSTDIEKLYQYLYEIPRVSTIVNYEVNKTAKTLKLEGVSDFFQYV